MVASNILGCLERNSITSNLLLNDSNYNYQKTRMMIYLQSVDYNLWDVVVKRPDVPKRTTDSNIIIKSFEQRDESDKKLCSMNTKAGNIVYCRLNTDIIKYPCVKCQRNMGYFSIDKVQIK